MLRKYVIDINWHRKQPPMARERRCETCYTVRLNEICNGLGKKIEEYQKKFIEESNGRHVSKEKTVMKMLRLLIEKQ